MCISIMVFHNDRYQYGRVQKHPYPKILPMYKIRTKIVEFLLHKNSNQQFAIFRQTSFCFTSNAKTVLSEYCKYLDKPVISPTVDYRLSYARVVLRI